MSYLVYGANGYSGRLIVREALRRGHRPILAGRSERALAAMARETGLEHRAFPLDARPRVEEALDGVGAVLHCAGPFIGTSKPMVDACLRTSTHYVDLAGQPEVCEALATRDAEAKSAKTMILPGAGVDVVPFDCLAAHLVARLPSAKRLVFGIQTAPELSRGTATNIAQNLWRRTVVRRDGVVTEVPAGWKTRALDFGVGAKVRACTLHMNAVATAFHSTAIPNIEVFATMPLPMRTALRMTRRLKWALGSSRVQRFLGKRIEKMPPGPTDEARAIADTRLYGEATDDAGGRVVTRLRGPEIYDWTTQIAVTVLERVVAGDAPHGYQTPSRAYGADFVFATEGVTRHDVM